MYVLSRRMGPVRFSGHDLTKALDRFLELVLITLPSTRHGRLSFTDFRFRREYRACLSGFETYACGHPHSAAERLVTRVIWAQMLPRFSPSILSAANRRAKNLPGHVSPVLHSDPEIQRRRWLNSTFPDMLIQSLVYHGNWVDLVRDFFASGASIHKGNREDLVYACNQLRSAFALNGDSQSQAPAPLDPKPNFSANFDPQTRADILETAQAAVAPLSDIYPLPVFLFMDSMQSSQVYTELRQAHLEAVALVEAEIRADFFSWAFGNCWE